MIASDKMGPTTSSLEKEEYNSPRAIYICDCDLFVILSSSVISSIYLIKRDFVENDVWRQILDNTSLNLSIRGADKVWMLLVKNCSRANKFSLENELE